jgi:hypothetical protein
MTIAWLSIVPTCDGFIDPAEWADAYMYDISDTTGQHDGSPDPLGTVYLWLKQDQMGVYFAVRNNADQTLNSYDEVGLFFDDNHDGCFPSTGNHEGNHWLDYQSSGITARWRPWMDPDCGFPPDYVCFADNVGTVYYWTPTCFGIGIGPTGVVDFEVMIPYGVVDEHLDLTMPPDSLGFFVFCMDGVTGFFPGTWPSQGRGNTYREPCYYGTLICEGSEQDSLYWKPPYENYAPSGMPDIDMFQGYGWWKTETGLPTFDGPCAVANCFKWFDSKYEEGFGGVPGDADDQFPLVRDYLDNLPTYLQVQDDHSPENVDIDWWHYSVHGVPITPWLQAATTPPPPTTQPFVPGYQYPPQPMPPWGELVERLAWYLDVDGVQSGYCNHSGTRPQEMHDGIQDWLESETFAGAGGEQQFIRGDVNASGSVDMADVTACVGGGPFPCDDAADVNDDGVLDQADCDYLLAYWQGGPPPPAPFPDCGLDPTADGLDCASFPPCPSLGPSLADTLCVNIWPMPTFELVETLVEKCEDMILLLGFWWQDPTGQWWRNGGHWVTVAGINSQDFLIAFSDPFIDNAEYGGRGRVGGGGYLEHNHSQWDQWTHNDEGNVSHDIYEVIDDPISPGGLWEIVDYGVPYAPPDFIASRFFDANVPPEFEPMTMPFDPTRTLVTEVEYAITAADVVFLLNYLFKGGSAPVPYIEGDTTCDGTVAAGDVVRLLAYLFRGDSIPRCCD